MTEITQQQIIQTYKHMESECRQFVTKISELEQERNEHDLVIKTLKPLPNGRKAFRLVGGVLVERTVESVLPSVVMNRENLVMVLTNLNEMLEKRSKETIEWKQKYNIKTQEEAEMEQKRMQQN
mmetsp:Transcript_4130/g.7722  ORF Transcript_4130/g.7722 Transcript_4130/m.7722 type:complete len:124 (+) Transcript_4130:87-458(+)|eukprot:CAMPEP_0182498488 /NCGR_PEP_ID=MMETSP1321-20130603/6664_1 /TAXON_ID=91990 /ORGANISM="Bolidomonas sp., Strain RCC1657" /LENGTH=123 /DNA_ID=CAMNT_0024702551 /DNA_START=160 /DNA_END=531 /DNA_ORIENTATION=-